MVRHAARSHQSNRVWQHEGVGREGMASVSDGTAWQPPAGPEPRPPSRPPTAAGHRVVPVLRRLFADGATPIGVLPRRV